MIKYSYEWFIEQSRAAQRDIEKWPADMKRNNFFAYAMLPTHDELAGRQREGETALDVAEPPVGSPN